MKVIQFPGTSELGKKGTKPKYIKPPQGLDILMGELQFTCPHCLTKANFNLSNMIFRTIEFYCANCGHLHKVGNPAFTKNK
jgi:predicted  nucleic acid-binding Zn ribbon protein